MMPRILPVEDEEVSAALEKSLKKAGIKILTNTKVTASKDHGDKVSLTVEGAAKETLEAEVCLIAIGVAPVLPGGVELKVSEKGWLETSATYETSVKGVFGAGDIIGPPWLAHVASYEAIQCVEGLFKKGHKPKKVTIFPGCTYCQPQVASIGMTEAQAKEKGLKYKVGKFPYQVSGKALAVGETEGFVKIIFGEQHGEIIGAHIIGNEATELIAEMGIAMTLEATMEEIEATIHAHPTLAEMLKEATEVAGGHPIHI
jgi:dihydrolipoamide dehydrogenase